MEEANREYGKQDQPDIQEFNDVLSRAEASPDQRYNGDMIIGGNTVSHKVRFLGERKGRKAYAVVSRNTSIHEANDTAESLHVAMAHVFNQYFRVDLYDEDGTVENIYLNTVQQAVADYENNAVKAVKIYSEMYLCPEDRERFREFYDITTVRDRIKAAGTEYVVDYYHSAIPGDKGRMQMYMILPFYYKNRWKYISLCRYADEIKDDIWK